MAGFGVTTWPINKGPLVYESTMTQGARRYQYMDATMQAARQEYASKAARYQQAGHTQNDGRILDDQGGLMAFRNREGELMVYGGESQDGKYTNYYAYANGPGGERVSLASLPNQQGTPPRSMTVVRPPGTSPLQTPGYYVSEQEYGNPPRSQSYGITSRGEYQGL